MNRSWPCPANRHAVSKLLRVELPSANMLDRAISSRQVQQPPTIKHTKQHALAVSGASGLIGRRSFFCFQNAAMTDGSRIHVDQERGNGFRMRRARPSARHWHELTTMAA
jgi:hypothetical protein